MVRTVRAQLSRFQYEKAWQAGKMLDLDAAAEYALEHIPSETLGTGHATDPGREGGR